MKIINFLHKFKFCRQIAKKIAKKMDIKQKFYNGNIYLNAVEHSWAWTSDRNYNNFDIDIQNYIHKTSKNHDVFIDIGSNIGVMTIGTLLNNKTIKSIAIDPNKQAVKLLKKSLACNKISDRCVVINSAIGNYDGEIVFDSTGSVTGHISDVGDKVNIIKLSNVLNEFKGINTLVKIDIEGYETQIIKELKNVNNVSSFTFVIELHELGFNGIGDPQYVFNVLKNMNAKIYDLNGKELDRLDQKNSTQISVNFI
ncbi:FkbM family methyltransferase [Mucilaginibacter sp.]